MLRMSCSSGDLLLQGSWGTEWHFSTFFSQSSSVFEKFQNILHCTQLCCLLQRSRKVAMKNMRIYQGQVPFYVVLWLGFVPRPSSIHLMWPENVCRFRDFSMAGWVLARYVISLAVWTSCWTHWEQLLVCCMRVPVGVAWNGRMGMICKGCGGFVL